MAIDRILATLIDHPGVSADELAKLSQTNAHTVRTVLQRNDRALARTSGVATGRGRPPLLYALKPEWRDILEAKWEARERRSADPLERALAILESASLAAIDPDETPEDRQRMREMVHVRSRAARVLLDRIGSEAQRAGALSRISRAERLVQPPEPEPALEPIPPLDDVLVASASSSVMRDWWRRWTDHVRGLAIEFGAEVWGGPQGGGEGLALVLDCIPGRRDDVSESLVNALSRHKPSFGINVAAWPAEQRARFMERFGELALDPIARKADLWVTCDSGAQESLDAWRDISRLAAADHLSRAIEIAGRALSEAMSDAETEAESPEAALRVQAAFMRDVSRLGDAPSLWRIYGAPQLLDVGRSQRLKVAAETQLWTYHADVHRSQLVRIASGLPVDQYA